MNAPFEMKLDKAAFNRWLDAQERKYEWKEGRVVQMTNVSRGHARIVANVLRALSARLDLNQWLVTVSDFGVEDETWVRFPDLIVEPENSDNQGRRALDPIILVEVLSPSSVGTGFTEKLGEYLSLASLEAYLIASQDEPICWVWQRQENGAFPGKPEEIAGREATLELKARAIALPLAEIYHGIGQS